MTLIERLANDKRSYERKKRYHKILVSIHYKNRLVDIETYDYDLKYLLHHGYIKKRGTEFILQEKAFDFMKAIYPDYNARYAIISLYTPFDLNRTQYYFRTPGIVRLIDDEYNHLNYNRPWTLFNTSHGVSLSDENIKKIHYKTCFDFNICKLFSDRTGRLIKSIDSLDGLKKYVFDIDDYFKTQDKEIENMSFLRLSGMDITNFIFNKNKDFYVFCKKILNKG